MDRLFIDRDFTLPAFPVVIAQVLTFVCLHVSIANGPRSFENNRRNCEKIRRYVRGSVEAVVLDYASTSRYKLD